MLDVVANSKQLNETEIFSQLERILKMAESAEERLPPVGILTSDGRTEWAQAREVLTKGFLAPLYCVSPQMFSRHMSLRLPLLLQIKPTRTLWP